MIPVADIIELLASRNFVKESKSILSNRLVHYEKAFEDKVCLVIFEGKHEMLHEIALDHLSWKIKSRH